MSQAGNGRAVGVLAILTSLGLMAFWAAFFFLGMKLANPPPCYLAFEHSFPLPDLILAAALLPGGVLFLKGARMGALLLLVCSGSLLFLGVLDFSFNIQNGVYQSSTGDLIGNAFINLWCVGFGLATARAAAQRLDLRRRDG